MAVIELYSKKQKKLRGEVNDVYQYNQIPDSLRTQIVFILKDCIGKDAYGYSNAKDSYKFINDTLCREYGVPQLNRYNTYEDIISNFLMLTSDTEKVLDIIDLSFKYIDRVIKGNPNYRYGTEVQINSDDAIHELNVRFKEHGVGFQFEGEIIRFDSTHIHSEIVKPVLSLLSSTKFIGADEEYRKAHEHYRHGRNKECLTECLKAFESVMKIICKEKNWTLQQTDTAKRLIQICFTNGLVPNYMQNQVTSLRTLLESGIPTIRNKMGGHGQGQSPIVVDDQLARYALNLTGSNIIFLVEQSGIK